METENQNTQTEAATTAHHKIIARDIKRELPCNLTQEEMLDIAIDKAKAEGELEQVRDEFRDVKDQWNERIEEAEKRIAQMGVEIRTRQRKRVVLCHERVVAETRMVEVVREDTNEVVDRRAANLFEAGKVLPQTKHLDVHAGDEPADGDVDSALAAAAAETQRAANVEETEDGDVVPPEGDGKRAKKGKRK